LTIEAICAPFACRTATRTVFAPHRRLCAISDKGARRPRNEDSYGILPDERVFAVADGIGGSPAGAVAADIAARAAIAPFVPRPGAECPRPPSVEQAVCQANLAVLQAAACEPAWHGMGATLMVGSVRGNLLTTAHLGDIRCYVRTRAGLVCLTRDHSPVAELVRAGLLSEAEARRHPQRHVVSRAAGMAGVRPTVNSHWLRPGERVLLSSDGLWGPLPPADLAGILSWQGSARRIGEELIERALACGGGDNLTLVLYEHY
jgi:protein phosphatase